MAQDLKQMLAARFGDAPRGKDEGSELLHSMAGRGSCRRFQNRPVPNDTLEMLSAVALASPSKSDLQQRDIIMLHSAEVRAQLAALVGGQEWVAHAPMIAVFCGNNRRLRLMHDVHDVPFANDHFDAPFNAAADAAIALGAFVTAAEAIGLGCCPISAVRNDAQTVSDLLGLPKYVFPFAGLAIGFPKQPARIAMRLPLSVTCHVDRYSEEGLQDAVQDYDRARAKAQPYGTQRLAEELGEKPDYGWSDDKVRQYSQPERASFGRYMRGQGFNFE